MEMTTEELAPGVAVLRCTGRLNMVAAKQFRSHIDETVRGGHRKVAVDLGGVSFIDSSGLGALVGGLKSARQAGGDLRIAAAGDQVRSVLELTNLARVLRPHDSVESATDGW